MSQVPGGGEAIQTSDIGKKTFVNENQYRYPSVGVGRETGYQRFIVSQPNKVETRPRNAAKAGSCGDRVGRVATDIVDAVELIAA